MATIKEVARKARVSVGTVSNVLSDTVPVSKRLRERVLEAIKQLDYHPNQIARSLKIRQTKMIGMVISDITNPAVPQLIRGAEDAAWRQKYMLITFNSDDRVEREQQVLSALRGGRVDGILLVATGSSHAHVSAIHEHGIPVVCLVRELPGISVDCVVADNLGGARECVRHLISLGHKKIGMLAGDLDHETARQRFLGYKQALADARIEYDERLVVNGALFRPEDGYRAGLELFSRGLNPSAAFTVNAAIALGFLRAVKDNNMRCPEDIALAAFDDPIFAEALRPALTAVAQPLFDIGAQGMELLLKRIEDPSRTQQRVVLDTKLNIRESSGSTRAAGL